MSKALSSGMRCFVAFAFTVAGVGNHAHAFKFDDGPIEGNIDTTLSFGISSRIDNADEDLYCLANGGSSFGCNNDDGNLNYDKGTISQVHKFTTDIEINHKGSDLGAFFRVKGFVDNKNNNANDTERTPLSSDARELVGSDIDVLDAYVWKGFELNGRSAEVRLGKHVLNWGESTFIQGGINALNPIDVAAIRQPGAELREALLPVNLLSASADVTNSLSIEGFYQLEWEETKPDPSGSYFSTNDFATDGGSQVFLGFGSVSDLGTNFAAAADANIAPGWTAGILNPILAVAGQTPVSLTTDPGFLAVSRAPDGDPDDSGQWGVSLKYFSQELNDTEFGFYYMNYHSRLPIISARTGTAAGVASAATIASGATATTVANTTIGAQVLAAGGGFADIPPAIALDGGRTAAAIQSGILGPLATDAYASTANYFIEYPEDIDLFGLSFNTNVGDWALQGEYSYKNDVPLQIDDVELLFAALTPIAPLLPYTTANQVTNGAVLGTNVYIPGYIERDVSQMQATVSKVFSNTMGANQFALVAEAAVTHVHDMPSKNRLRLNGPATNTSGNPFHSTAAGGHTGKAYEESEHFPDATSWGYRVLGRWTYNNAYKAVNLIPRVAFQHDVDGVTPGPGGNFIEDRKAVTLGLTATYKNQWSADVSYTDFFGAGEHNLLGDRDFVSFNIKYSF